MATAVDNDVNGRTLIYATLRSAPASRFTNRRQTTLSLEHLSRASWWNASAAHPPHSASTCSSVNHSETWNYLVLSSLMSRSRHSIPGPKVNFSASASDSEFDSRQLAISQISIVVIGVGWFFVSLFCLHLSVSTNRCKPARSRVEYSSCYTKVCRELLETSCLPRDSAKPSRSSDHGKNGLERFII